jgi:hypothetical protein
MTASIVDAVNHTDIVSSTDLDVVWLFSDLLTITTATVKKLYAAALFLFISIL